jgi:hypothetical protein
LFFLFSWDVVGGRGGSGGGGVGGCDGGMFSDHIFSQMLALEYKLLNMYQSITSMIL